MTDSKEEKSWEDMTFIERFPTYMKEIQEAMPGVLKAMLDNGVPIYYEDENGRQVKEMPNGEIIVLEEAEE